MYERTSVSRPVSPTAAKMFFAEMRRATNADSGTNSEPRTTPHTPTKFPWQTKAGEINIVFTGNRVANSMPKEKQFEEESE